MQNKPTKSLKNRLKQAAESIDVILINQQKKTFIFNYSFIFY